MKLREQHSSDGRRLNKALHDLLLALGLSDTSLTEVYVDLWDVHDGALRIVHMIEKLAQLDPGVDLKQITHLLFTIQAELFDHISPHLRGLEPELGALCSTLADRLPDPPNDD
ncbi:MAG: hypothetical protein JWM27_2920 [Gemmatimonadetes bacterium]|nr:hypothetical protein [Gemmatimonadota bacterium]